MRPPAARVRQDDPRIMAFDAFRAEHPHATLTLEQRRRYASLCARASQARAYLRNHPEMVGWYAQREMLASMGMDVAGAGPSPVSPAGRAAARARAEQDRQAQAQEHAYLMTCQLPDPLLVRVGERTAEALAERRAAAAERRRIEAYRREHGRAEARQLSSAAVLDDPASTPAQRRQARMGTAWDVRVQEDELFMAREGLAVRCHRHTQSVPMIRRRHRAGS